MNLGQLLAGQKGLLYKVANTNEKALREEKRIKIEELRRLKDARETRMHMATKAPLNLPTAWMSEEPIELTTEIF